jgi:hypothetical protein
MNSRAGLIGSSRSACRHSTTEQVSQSEPAYAQANVSEKVPACLEELVFEKRIHVRVVVFSSG